MAPPQQPPAVRSIVCPLLAGLPVALWLILQVSCAPASASTDAANDSYRFELATSETCGLVPADSDAEFVWPQYTLSTIEEYLEVPGDIPLSDDNQLWAQIGPVQGSPMRPPRLRRRRRGRRQTSINTMKLVRRKRLAGAYTLNDAQFPAYVHIQRNLTKPRDQGYLSDCGGALVGDHLVLTSGRCTAQFKSSDTLRYVASMPYEKKELNDNLTSHMTSDVLYACTHPDYVKTGGLSSSGKNDLGLFVLKDPFRGSDRVRPACLPTPGSALAQELLGDLEQADFHRHHYAAYLVELGLRMRPDKGEKMDKVAKKYAYFGNRLRAMRLKVAQEECADEGVEKKKKKCLVNFHEWGSPCWADDENGLHGAPIFARWLGQPPGVTGLYYLGPATYASNDRCDTLDEGQPTRIRYHSMVEAMASPDGFQKLYDNCRQWKGHPSHEPKV